MILFQEKKITLMLNAYDNVTTETLITINL
jgi:hypothetical protein